jgi:hypothetical protein
VSKVTVSYSDYLKALTSQNAEMIYKVELLNNKEVPLRDITSDLIDGSVTLTLQNGARRSANITLMNLDNKYTPDSTRNIWLDSKFRIWVGIKVNGEDYLFSKGIFVLYEPQINSTFTDTTASFNLVDKWSYFNGDLGGTLASDYIIPVNTNIGSAVSSIVTTQVKDVNTPIISSISTTSPYTLTMTHGDTFAEMILKLADMVSYEVFFDSSGILRFQAVADDNLRPSKYDFSTHDVMYLGSNRRYIFNKIRNSVRVYGDNVNGLQVIGQASDNNIFSPTSILKITERVKVIDDEIINTVDLANQRAVYELKKAVILQEIVDVRCIPIPHLEEENIITIEDAGNGLQRDRYLIQSLSYPLRYDGEMQLSVWKVREIE